MALSAGDRLGPYEILSRIGAGGMGEVWKARDTRLNRDVAIKTSRVGFSGRFQKEAQAIAALNHPNICTLYDIGPDYLVMEFIEGWTLAERIAQGALPVNEALRIAAQIAAALEEAHEKTIVHRDLKPANVKVRPDGSVKVLDFGLARTGEAAADSTSDSPTLMTMPTQAGVIMGTAGYMSPEQARGQVVDKRADIFSFGVVFCEMLTGRRLFDGETVSDSLAAILKTEPDLSSVPAQFRRVLRGCLEKDPRKRLRDIGDYAQLMGEETVQTAKQPRIPWLVAGLSVAAALAVFAWYSSRPAAQQPVVRFNISPPEGGFEGTVPRAAISPDGTQIVFHALSNGQPQLWLRRLDSTDAQPLAGTDQSDTGAFWSPDSRSIGFFAERKLKRLDLATGVVQVLCDAAQNDQSGTWSPDGTTILFSGRNPDTPVTRVPASGGSPVAVLKRVSGEEWQRYPRFLPDGKRFLYHSSGTKGSAIAVGSMSGETRELMASPGLAEYANGHILYRLGQQLVARPFDYERLEFTGDPVPLAPYVGMLDVNGRVSFSVSTNGYLEYFGMQGIWTLSALDRAGHEKGSAIRLGTYGFPGTSISPDRRRLAYVTGRNTAGAFSVQGDLWAYDLERRVPSRITLADLNIGSSAWLPGDRGFVIGVTRNGKSEILRTSISGSAEPTPVYVSANPLGVEDVSRDGRWLAFTEGPRGRRELFLLSMAETVDRVPLETGPFDRWHARFSPDGRSIAYTGNESGSYEVYLRPVQGTEQKVRISANGGSRPQWRADGRGLYYIGVDAWLNSVAIGNRLTAEVSAATRLFRTSIPLTSDSPGGYVVSGDDQLFYMNMPAIASSAAPITVVQNWPALLRK